MKRGEVEDTTFEDGSVSQQVFGSTKYTHQSADILQLENLLIVHFNSEIDGHVEPLKVNEDSWWA